MATVAERMRSPRRAELIRAAARLFSTRGYHGTSMQHLADALGLQRGSLYAHIGSKQDLLFDVVEEGAEHFLARGEDAVALEGLESATVFLNEWRYLSPQPRAEIKAKRDAYEAMLVRIIEEGISAGDFRPDADVRFATLLTLSAGNWTYAWYKPGGDMTPRDIGERFAELIIKGLEA
jgi:TetR/AcrR family transcriptional regulator, cholesterol catabolism regulator